jgi:hypothetical protein
MIPSISPSLIWRLTPFTAVKFLYILVIESNFMISVISVAH